MPPEKERATSGQLVAGTGLSAAGSLAHAHYATNGHEPQEPTIYDSLLDGSFHSPEQLAREQLAEALTGSPDGKIAWSAGELLAAQFPDPVWAVPNLLPAGLSILAGRPKLGKSWLALQMAVAAGTGGIVLGERVERRQVLYLALEDSGRRLQDRLKLQQCPADASVHFVSEWPALLKEGLAYLLRMIEQQGATFVIVDTLGRWASVRKAEDEALVAERLGELQRFAMGHNVAVLLVEHHRKPGAGGVQDVIDDVIGATSKTAVADAALGLYRQRGQQGAELKLTGRDVLDRELAVQFDKQIGCWQLLGDSAHVKASSLQSSILEALMETFGGQSTCTEVARFLGKDRGNVHRELQELVNKGKLRKIDKQGKESPYKVLQDE